MAAQDEDDLGGMFLVAVEDVAAGGALWAYVRDALETRSTIHGLTLYNKVGRAVTVDKLSLQFVQSSDKRLQRLRPFAHSPVVWFRNPYAHLLLVSTSDPTEYRNVLKPALKKALAELERDWGAAPGSQPAGSGGGLLGGAGGLLGVGGGASAASASAAGGFAGAPAGVGAEWLVVYVRPPEMDPADKGIRKIVDKLKDDFNPKGKNRVVRLDPTCRPGALGHTPLATRAAVGPFSMGASAGTSAGFGTAPGGPMAGGSWGLEELEGALRECVRSSYEGRQAAYMAEVKRVSNERLEPGWSFASLYLIKDSLALMMEAAGLAQDAYKEYVELEAAYLETLTRQQQHHQQHAAQHEGVAGAPPAMGDDRDFSVGAEGEDVASLINASWRATRRVVLKKSGVPEFRFRQYLFAAQTRLLLRLGRPVDVCERGLRFVAATARALARQEARGLLRPLFAEAWTFSACLALLAAVTGAVFGFTSNQPPSQPAPSPHVPDAAEAAAHQATQWARDVAADRHEGAEGAGGTGDGAAVPFGSGVRHQHHGRHHHSGVPDWQLHLPLDPEVPLSDPATLAGLLVSPLNLSLLRRDMETLAREATHRAYFLALAQLYSTALTALLRLARRAAALLHDAGEEPPPSGGGSAGALGRGAASALAADEAYVRLQQQRRELALGLAEVACQYPGQRAVGICQEEADGVVMFEATPLQQATQLQLLRQAIGGADAVLPSAPYPAGAATTSASAGVGTPRQAWAGPDASALAASPSNSMQNSAGQASDASLGGWPGQGGGSAPAHAPHHSRSDSLHSINITGGSGAEAWPCTQLTGAVVGAGSPFTAVPGGGGAASALAYAQSQRLSHASSSGTFAAHAGGVPPRPGGTLSGASASGAHPPTGGVGFGRASTQAQQQQQQQLAGGAPHAHPHHHRSSSADNSQGQSLLSKLGNKVSSLASEALKPLKTAPSSQYGGGSGMPSPRAVEEQVELTSLQLNASTVSQIRDAVRQAQQAALQEQAQSQPQDPQDGPHEQGGQQQHHHHPQDGEQPHPTLHSFAPHASHAHSAPAPLAAASPAGGMALLPELSWLGEWRLRLAMSSAHHAADLALQLALAAAACQGHAGRQRSAACLYSDVASLLLGRGQAEIAAALLEHMASLALAEGWPVLLSSCLLRLVEAQQMIGHVMLPYTCIRYLALPPSACCSAGRRQVLEAVLDMAAGAGAGDRAGARGQGQGGPLTPSANTPRNGKLPRGKLPYAALQLNALQAIMAAVPSRLVSKFYGRELQGGTLPALVPPAHPPTDQDELGSTCHSGRPSGAGRSPMRAAGAEGGGAAAAGRTRGGAQLIRVGDVASITLCVYSNLPAAVSLSGVTLVLGQLQPPPRQQRARQSLHNRASSAHAMTQALQPAASAGLQQAPATGPAPPSGRALFANVGPISNSGVGLGHSLGSPAGPAPASVAGGWGEGAPSAAAANPRLHAVSLASAAPYRADRSVTDSGMLTPGQAGQGAGGASAARLHGSHLTAVGQPGFDRGPPALLQQQQALSVDGGVGGSVSSFAAYGSYSGALPSAATGPGSTTMAAAVAFAQAAERPGLGGSLTAASTRAADAAPGLAGGRRAGSTADGVLGGGYPSSQDAAGQGQGQASQAGLASGAGVSSSASLGRASMARALSSGALAAMAMAPGGSTSGASMPAWVEGEELTCPRLLSVQHVQALPGADTSSPPLGGQAQDDPWAVTLLPGMSLVTFQAAPRKQGLYLARHISARLGAYELRVPVMQQHALARDCGPRLATAAGGGDNADNAAFPGWLAELDVGSAAAAGGQAGGIATSSNAPGATLARLGQAGDDGEVVAQEVVLLVLPAVAPRVMLAPVAVGGALVAGMPQWLGVALAPSGPEESGESCAGAAEPGLRTVNGGGLSQLRIHIQSRVPAVLRIGEPHALATAPTGASSLAGGHSGALSSLLASGVLELGGQASFGGAGPYGDGTDGMLSPQPRGVLAATPSNLWRRADAFNAIQVAVVDLEAWSRAQEEQPPAPPYPATVPAVAALASTVAVSGGSGSPGSAFRIQAQHVAQEVAASLPQAVLPPPPLPAGHSWALMSARGSLNLAQLSGGLGEAVRAPLLLWLPVAVTAIGQEQGIGLSSALRHGPAVPEVVKVAQPHMQAQQQQQRQSPGGTPRVMSPSGGRQQYQGNSSAQLSVRISTGRGLAISPGLAAAQPPNGTAAAGPRPLPSAEVEVVLEYCCRGVWHSHASTLAVPLCQPFRITTTAHQLPNERVLVAVSAVCELAMACRITSIELTPQPGLQLVCPSGSPERLHSIAEGTEVGGALGMLGFGGAAHNRISTSQAPMGGSGGGMAGTAGMGLAAGVLPLVLAPGSKAMWAFMLEREPGAPPGLELDTADCSRLQLWYSLLPGGAPLAAEEVMGPTLQPVSGYSYPLPPVAAHGALQGQLDPQHGIGRLMTHSSPGTHPGAGAQQPPTPGLQPPAAPLCGNLYSHTGAFIRGMSSAGGAGPGVAPHGASYSHVHLLLLEFPADTALSQNLVSVRLLGPHHAVLGQPVSLLWQVSRVGGAGSYGRQAAVDGCSAGGAAAALAEGWDQAVYEVVGEEAHGTVGRTRVQGGVSRARLWQQAMGCKGTIRLGRARGSIAVVEVVVCPTATGVLPAPCLRLKGLRDVRAEEGVDDTVMVTPA